MSMTVFSQE